MKNPSFAVKVLTVTVFATLIVCFICYRVGAFDAAEPGSDEMNYASLNNSIAVDTPVVPKDSVVIEKINVEMMSSSKSMVVPRSFKQDTVKKVPADSTKKKPLQKKTTMSSSKSGIIFEPEPVDTTKPKK